MTTLKKYRDNITNMKEKITSEVDKILMCRNDTEKISCDYAQ